VSGWAFVWKRNEKGVKWNIDEKFVSSVGGSRGAIANGSGRSVDT
jgi:hypothetical protein